MAIDDYELEMNNLLLKCSFNLPSITMLLGIRSHVFSIFQHYNNLGDMKTNQINC